MQMMINNTCARSGVIALVMSVTKYESEDCVRLCQDKWNFCTACTAIVICFWLDVGFDSCRNLVVIHAACLTGSSCFMVSCNLKKQCFDENNVNKSLHSESQC